MDGLFRFPNVQCIAFFLALYGIDNAALFVPWCGGFELHRNVLFFLLNFSETPDRYGMEML